MTTAKGSMSEIFSFVYGVW